MARLSDAENELRAAREALRLIEETLVEPARVKVERAQAAARALDPVITPRRAVYVFGVGVPFGDQPA